MFRAIGHAGRNPLMGVTRRTAAKKIIAAPRVSMSTSKGGFNPAAADQNITAQSIFHKTSIASLVLTPIALVAHPSPLSMPLDVILAITFPLHAHIGLQWIMTDYVAGAGGANSPLRFALTGVSALCALGLLRLAVSGDGLVGTLKSIWKSPKDLEESRKE
mmetsp:Transcript_6112/g.10861  ORF Transcript_6112/g.10861 Transcript_6112/m.10861 type:complete len:161 (-) Transcript_6112:43-525(-)|eukprot:CAMPEP_0184540848 /NCGR_PEP_ID=MMETSP0199_2-20130426/985_1 /TAXON_ID=1112570 /ORGANISM="Thraustochytrium sp., Strain LLF1b" /LENGTH=160 /DNA_ID=CAMNT_0026934513 /DNA_START=95 /DNA_END=577 /DNA_ORIENTATION=+